MSYTSQNLEVLTGLDPVRRRPGMYTDTTRPNHLAQEVIDNSVDEALAGHAKNITVILHQDGSLSVEDDGRGMPTDVHPEFNQSGIELILTRLHAGGKFSTTNYQVSGGLHGVGISVVNALSHKVHVTVWRQGEEFTMQFGNGEPLAPLAVAPSGNKRKRGTLVRFWANEQYFDSPKFNIKQLKHHLKAKAVLSAGLTITFVNEIDGETEVWQFADGLSQYLTEQLVDDITLPEQPYVFDYTAKPGERAALSFAICWLAEGGTPVQESYVNLIPTAQGGTHVNGLRTGITEAL